MSERSAAPGGLVLVESLVNTLDIESGADALETADGRAPFGLAEDEVPAARELRESLRAVLLAHAGHLPHARVTPLDDLLATAPLRLTVDAVDGSAALTAADVRPLNSRVAAAVAEALVAGDLAAPEGLRGRHLPLGVLRPQPGHAALVLDAGVRGARENAPVPGEVVHPQRRGRWCRMQPDAGSAD